MTYEEFLFHLKENLISPWDSWRISFHDKKDQIGVSWSLGGTHGNCYDSELSSVSGDVEPDLTDLDLILEYYCPNISFLQYKTMYSKLLHRGTDSSGDYYGGSITYGYKYINLEELFEWLKEKGYID